MKSRVIVVDCDAGQARMLARVIRDFTDAAYPPGGSECTQVARSTLLETATSCDQHPGGALDLRKRQLPMLRNAVDWWLNEHVGDTLESAQGLTALLSTK